MAALIEMPPLQFARTNGIRMGYYEAGPNTDTPPVILCHGWPEIAFSWRHQIKALSEAGIRVIAPDQRGYGATDRPEAGRSLRHRTSDRRSRRAARPSQDRQGDLRRPRLGRLHRLANAAAAHRSRRRRRRHQHPAHRARPPSDPIELLRQRFGDQMYIVQFQNPAREPDRIFDSRVEQTFDAFMRKPVPRSDTAPAEPPTAGVGASPKLNLAFPQMIAGYDAKHDPRTPILSPRRRRCSSTPSPKRASPAASTGIATCRATGSARPTSTIRCGCRR